MDAPVLSPIPVADTGDQRDNRRARCLLSGFAVWDGGHVSVPCLVQDLSTGGARLKIPDTTPVPNRFAFLEATSGRAHAAQVVWRRHPQVGIKFAAPIDLSREDETARTLRRLWTERRPR